MQHKVTLNVMFIRDISDSEKEVTPVVNAFILLCKDLTGSAQLNDTQSIYCVSEKCLYPQMFINDDSSDRFPSHLHLSPQRAD